MAVAPPVAVSVVPARACMCERAKKNRRVLSGDLSPYIPSQKSCSFAATKKIGGKLLVKAPLIGALRLSPPKDCEMPCFRCTIDALALIALGHKPLGHRRSARQTPRVAGVRVFSRETIEVNDTAGHTHEGSALLLYLHEHAHTSSWSQKNRRPYA